MLAIRICHNMQAMCSDEILCFFSLRPLPHIFKMLTFPTINFEGIYLMSILKITHTTETFNTIPFGLLRCFVSVILPLTSNSRTQTQTSVYAYMVIEAVCGSLSLSDSSTGRLVLQNYVKYKKRTR